MVEDEGEGLDYYGDLPALLLEDSMELKRRIHPPEVVQVRLCVCVSVCACERVCVCLL